MVHVEVEVRPWPSHALHTRSSIIALPPSTRFQPPLFPLTLSLFYIAQAVCDPSASVVRIFSTGFFGTAVRPLPPNPSDPPGVSIFPTLRRRAFYHA
ncbi:hypothetical protein EJ06DRAFT_279301 [Trichodelitschia bisporula]|uniref:Uncharacterized protein n=1 Tax=Trichodelitschia bisporula TaxID=703511 RepID=A0A6G1I5D4_9PEZI|nr:hypothetical protein EJ06DRAFT_279301 [Trichodelitschia bisporula]